MNIALLSPNKSSYSETFIQEQKNALEKTFNVFYYYDGFIPVKLEHKGSILIKHGTFKRKLGFISDNIRIESLKKSFKKNKIDVVFAHYGPTGEAVANLCKALNKPLVVHFHGYDASIGDVILKNNNYKNVFKYAKTIIAVSKEMVKDLMSLGCDEKKIIYNPCVANPVFYDVKPKYNTQQFVAVGRFTDKKAPYYTILAFSKVVKTFPEATLIMAGKGELLNTCKNLVNYLGLSQSIKFVGVIDRQKLLVLFSESLAFIQHSITASNGDKEGTPVAIVEASAAGLPVISTYHAGIPDVISHNKTGLLGASGDVNKMTDNICELLIDIEKTKILGQNAKINISENFNFSKYIAVIETILLNHKKK